MKTTIGATSKFVPKAHLRYDEYRAIKYNFSGADFERANMVPFIFPFVYGFLWVTQKAFRRLKVFV